MWEVSFLFLMMSYSCIYLFTYLAIFIEHPLSQALCQACRVKQIQLLSSGELQLMGQTAITQIITQINADRS